MSNTNLFAAAINLGLVDALDLGNFLVERNGDVAKILEDLDEVAEALKHEPTETRASWIKVREAVTFFEKDDPTKDDRFGFSKEARAAAHAALSAAGVKA